MKTVLSFFAMFALVMSLTTVNAQDKPKEAAKTEKSSCCSGSQAKKSGSCDESATKTKKMASKHDCSDKCDDGCTMASKTKTSTSDAKKN
ncbi:MAG: hypothetical protein WAV84_11055 [Bacteroidota bacterium]